ncbi:MAG: dipeptide epimerase [Fimbriimonadales bacterium]|nr:dipeptide epimerase [Fimbriimonadales bacterium]
MQLAWATFTVNKRFALTISRGTTARTVNVWVRIEADGIEGWGEASPFSIGDIRQSTEAILEDLVKAQPLLTNRHPLERERIENLLITAGIGSAARAAIDIALWDWLGKRTGLPVWRMLGLSRETVPPTSVTIGINPPEVARQRTRDWLQLTNAKSLKVKLGNPAGVAADQAMFEAVRQGAPQSVAVRVDANGGWSLQDALTMCHWLAERGVEYVEQPLPRGAENELRTLFRESPLPIFVDESCLDARDVVRLADRVHGVNLKLMKCGGLSEAWRAIHAAQAFGLQIMLGCYSDSSLAISAASQIAPLAQFVDLDSHLNLRDDPFIGAALVEGRVLPCDAPGLGVQLRGMFWSV